MIKPAIVRTGSHLEKLGVPPVEQPPIFQQFYLIWPSYGLT